VAAVIAAPFFGRHTKVPATKAREIAAAAEAKLLRDFGNGHPRIREMGADPVETCAMNFGEQGVAGGLPESLLEGATRKANRMRPASDPLYSRYFRR